MKALRKLGWVIGFIFCFSASARANNPLFDNLLSGNYDGPGFSNGNWGADAFSTDNQSYQLGDITLRAYASATSANATLQIFDSAGSSPGSTLIGTMNTPSFVTSTAIDTVFTPNGSIILSPNTEYWVRLQGNDQNAVVYWSYSFDALATKNAINLGSGIESYTDGPFLMKVEGTAISSVPVPAAIWLMGSALTGLIGFSRRQVS